MATTVGVQQAVNLKYTFNAKIRIEQLYLLFTLGSEPARGPKVTELGDATITDEDILGLDVSMNCGVSVEEP